MYRMIGGNKKVGEGAVERAGAGNDLHWEVEFKKKLLIKKSCMLLEY